MALVPGRLGAEGPGDGAAIGAIDGARFAQLRQVAADGLAGDAKFLRQFRDADGGVGAQLLQDSLLPVGLLGGTAPHLFLAPGDPATDSPFDFRNVGRIVNNL